jgi:zinc-ribbon domain
MPEICTCGAQLPEDARFCHKCGRPLNEIAHAQAPAVETPIAPPPLQPVAPSFHHPVAVRVGLFVAGVATLLCLLLPYGFVIWLPAAGFIAVYLFSRRTGQSLSVRNGARMGWMAGILSFVIATVLLTLFAVALANTPGGIEQLRQQLSARAVSSEDVERALAILGNPKDRALFFIQFLAFWFMFSSVFCAAGGALGAKVLAKD